MTAAAGWQFDGSFLRGNTDFDAVNGALWTQDLSASIKIIAARHDNHDEVLSNGIEATLNLDGLNSMRANLKMGGFKITGLADATGLTDIPTYGQTAGSMTFAADVLALLDRNGTEIDNVSIPTGGGGTGTVSSITAGAGLDGGTINVAGTISLEALAPGQTYSGGISAIVIDNHGRVTQVTTGAFANTNLFFNYENDHVLLTSSTGTGDTLWGAGIGNAGAMTAAHVINLNSNTDRITALEAGASGMKPPIEIQGIQESPVAGLLAAAGVWSESVDDSFKDTDNFYTIIDHTGSGIFEFLACEYTVAPSGSPGIDIRLTIDGVVVWLGDNIWDAAAQVIGSGIVIIGAIDPSEGISLGQVTYSSRLLLEASNTQTTDATLRTFYKYQKTG